MSVSARPAFKSGQVFPRVARLGAFLTAAAALLGPSTASAWVFGDYDSYTNLFSMAGDGRYVVFESEATNRN